MAKTLTLIAATLAAATAVGLPAGAQADAFDPFDIQFDWRSDAFGHNGLAGMPGSTNNTECLGGGAGGCGLHGEATFVMQMPGGVTGTISALNGGNANNGAGKPNGQMPVMTWTSEDGIGMDSANNPNGYEYDEIEGPNELLRFEFSAPIALSKLYFTDLFENENHGNQTSGNGKKKGNGNKNYDEFGFFKLHLAEDGIVGDPNQVVDDNTYMFTAGGQLVRLTDGYDFNSPPPGVTGGTIVEGASIVAGDTDNGEWAVILPQPVQILAIDFWAPGSGHSMDIEFALAGLDGQVVPTNTPTATASVPEPAPMALLLAGLIGLGAVRRRARA